LEVVVVQAESMQGRARVLPLETGRPKRMASHAVDHVASRFLTLRATAQKPAVPRPHRAMARR
jgi:hypothetical protein